MIVKINTPAGEKTMLLGYSVIRHLATPKKEDKDQMEQVLDAALVGFNTWAKRQNEPTITQEEMVDWFEVDEEAFLAVIEAVTKFSENFTQRVSGPVPTPEESQTK